MIGVFKTNLTCLARNSDIIEIVWKVSVLVNESINSWLDFPPAPEWRPTRIDHWGRRFSL